MGQTFQSITINAPVDRVWQTIRNFHDLSWSPNVVTGVEKIGNNAGDQIGACRLLNGVFRETLTQLDDENKTFSYSIDDGPSPVSKDEVANYIGCVKVLAAGEGDGTLVEWSSTWENKDEQVHDFCHPIYVALLDDMKNSLE